MNRPAPEALVKTDSVPDAVTLSPVNRMLTLAPWVKSPWVRLKSATTSKVDVTVIQPPPIPSNVKPANVVVFMITLLPMVRPVAVASNTMVLELWVKIPSLNQEPAILKAGEVEATKVDEALMMISPSMSIVGP